jgi:soluble lytic murein transglycosylase
LRRELIGAVLACSLSLLVSVPASSSEPRAKAAPAPQAQQTTELTPDQALLAARRAYLKRDARAFEAAASQAKAHPLADYIHYWRLSLRLRAAPAAAADTDREVERMLQQHTGSLPADLLRREWLNQLATRGEWSRFDQQYSLLSQAPDAGLRCQRAISMLSRQDSVAADTVETLLMVPRDLPEACQRLFDQLLQAGKLAPQDPERRFLRALESGSRTAIRLAAMGTGVPPAELDRALGASDSSPADGAPLSRLATMIRIAQLARNDPALAAAALDRQAGKLRPADREFLWSQIAAAGMKRLAPESLSWTRQGLRAAASDETFAWLARAALRERDWLMVGQVIERMSPSARQDPAWIYWAARALSETGRKVDGERLLTRIAPGFDFYGLLASEDLGRPIRLPPPLARPLEPGEIEAAGKNRGLARALRLYGLGLRPEGNREWSHAIRGLSDRQLIATAAWACQRGVHDRCVNTAELTRTEHDFALRFVTPFKEYIKQSSNERGLDPAWVYGLIRQESRFITDIRSSAGAQGLMQIMPATGRWIAGKLEQRNFRLEQLHEARTNIRFGTFYLRNVLDGLDGSPVLASAGYNAGPGRPQRWRETLAAPIEGEIFAEIIPFNETRDYVKKVLTNATLYSALLSGQPQSLRAWLGRVGPQQSVASAQP